MADTHSTHRDHQVQLGLDHEIQSADDRYSEIQGPISFYDDRWWTDYYKVVRLGRLLMRHGWSAEALQRYYETPWRFDAEWERYCTGQLPRSLSSEGE